MAHLHDGTDRADLADQADQVDGEEISAPTAAEWREALLSTLERRGDACSE